MTIPSGTTHKPTIPAITGVTVNTITINSGATLTILYGSVVNAATWTIDGALVANAADSPIALNSPPWSEGGVMNVSSTGSITKLGTADLYIYAALNNDGSVIFTDHGSGGGGVSLIRGGTHTGKFEGEYLFVGNNYEVSGQIFNFNSGSVLDVNQFHARGGTVNLFGSISQLADTGTSLSVQPNGGASNFYIKTGGGMLETPEYIFIDYGGKLILESQTGNYNMRKLSLGYNGELQNDDELTITTQFLWGAGKITGSGTTTVETAATFTMGGSSHPLNDFTLNNQTLINNSTANWNKRDLTLTNAATFVNNGTFNANATTTMIRTETEVFTNNGSFIKYTAGTTTIMDIPFTNNGTVDVVAGSLVFQQGMDNGEDAVIDLGGGTLDPGDELNLESGDSLIGSGTLSANLVNGGTVSPGASPGIITVQGDYTQTADGILEIELGGTTPGTGHDQLVVTGTATMFYGTLNVTLETGYTPEEGDEFVIISHTTGTGTFDTVNLPDLEGGLELEIDFSDPGVALTVVSTGGSTGSISGTVTCDSTHSVFVDLWADDYTSPPPEYSTTIACGETYSFTGLPNGTYYVGAWIDLDESGGAGGPDDGEPLEWYGNPTAVTITGGGAQNDIDISIPSGSISGTVTCDSPHEVFVDLYKDDTTPPPADTAHTTCGGTYNFSFLPDGTYYVSAWIDLDDSGGGPPGEDETIIWYGNPTAVTITGGETKENIDIVFPKEKFMIFLPLIVR